MSSGLDPAGAKRRLRAALQGAVQGVGFRPFVFRLATQLGLAGWVNNSPQGVTIEVEGGQVALQEFLRRLELEKPPRSFIQSLEASWLDVLGYEGFVIRESEASGEKTTLVLPDIATCPECLAEILDPANRRYLYPFTNCTHCGPRFSIIESLPYDRAHTSMKRFTMCPQCQAEYDDPSDRRFHAQPNACPKCGPRLELWDAQGEVVAHSLGRAPVQPGGPMPPDALERAARAILAGRVIAVKGLGGFHLMVRADVEEPIQALRQRKHRQEKPFAVMFPDAEAVLEACEVTNLEERVLRSPEAPVVLLRRRSGGAAGRVCAGVAPGNPYLGALLPYTPLHHLLLRRLRVPVVATSGNLSDEPICTDEREALIRLSGIADFFLVHDRPIVRHVDDSIVRQMAQRELVLRRARGFAPLPVRLRGTESGKASRLPTVLAVGAHLKNTVALAVGPQVFISQHIGDLETPQAFHAFERVTGDLQRLYEAPASVTAADLHPDYLSTRFAEQAGVPCAKVQHHVAHVLSCMAENELDPPVLGVAWDGTGYGTDGTIWGGEFFRITPEGFERVAHFRPFHLPGGEQAIREPRRCALGLLFEAFGAAAFERTELAPVGGLSAAEKASFKTMLARQLNSPRTSSVGRLFDAMASLAGIRQHAHFEGQAAMELEFLLDGQSGTGGSDVALGPLAAPGRIDWQPCLAAVLDELSQGVAPGRISARFHRFLVESILAVARATGLERVVLSGGCFQNRYLCEQAIATLSDAGFRPYWHQRVPPNDGGISLGQVVAARLWKV